MLRWPSDKWGWILYTAMGLLTAGLLLALVDYIRHNHDLDWPAIPSSDPASERINNTTEPSGENHIGSVLM
ncbi:hypothetical protein [Haloferula sp. BvORR071]|uniref:hypothetical protein n=1 Tax=Haloferula sp. BvORR071 TaxID=1396141 RepID=UPI00054D1EEF|nr:hypothetical protein [Haloferula sp. BvORR071]